MRIVRDGKKLARPFLDVSGRISAGGERGLLSLAFAPDYALERAASTSTTRRATATSGSSSTAARAPTARDARLRARRAVGRRIRRPTTTAAWCCSGPTACSTPASATAAEAATGTAPAATAQNLGTLLGKILRIDPRRDGSRAYRVPSRNPFVGRGGARPEIYAYGAAQPVALLVHAERATS